MSLDAVSGFSVLPIVRLDGSSPPIGGAVVQLTQTCQRNLEKGAGCIEHYTRMRTLASGEFVQCPHGFTSVAFDTSSGRAAVTGVVAWPRFGTPSEALMAKKHPEARIAREAVLAAAAKVAGLSARLIALEAETVRQQSMALHEIRKLNRQVKQTAERLCLRASPGNIEEAPVDLVSILKASELMSQQFDVIEILANETLAKLPRNSSSHIYKIFDKCARIYRTGQRRIVLDSPANFSPIIDACDKTFPIIPATLIENAQKYAVGDSDIKISIRPDGDFVAVQVENLANLTAPLTNRIFERGVRVSGDRDGSGNGLYVAQLVAAQHDCIIHVDTLKVSESSYRVRFHFKLKTRAR